MFSEKYCRLSTMNKNYTADQNLSQVQKTFFSLQFIGRTCFLNWLYTVENLKLIKSSLLICLGITSIPKRPTTINKIIKNSNTYNTIRSLKINHKHLFYILRWHLILPQCCATCISQQVKQLFIVQFNKRNGNGAFLNGRFW